MKRKLSFLIAAIMVLSLLPAMSVSAASDNTLLSGGGTVKKDDNWTESPTIMPVLQIDKKSPLATWKAGDTFELRLTNAKWIIADYFDVDGMGAGDLVAYPPESAGAATGPISGTKTDATADNLTGLAGIIYSPDRQATLKAKTAYVENGAAANFIMGTTNTAGTGGVYGAGTVGYEITQLGTNRAKVTLTGGGAAQESIIIPLMVELTGEGDARVEVTNALGSMSLTTGSYAFGRGASGATNTYVEEDDKTFSNWVDIDDIVIEETRVGSIDPDKSSGTIKLTLPNGFKWVNSAPDVELYAGFVPGHNTRVTTSFGKTGGDNTVMDIGIGAVDVTTGTRIATPIAQSSGTAGTIVISGLRVQRTDSIAKTKAGDVNVKVSVPGGTAQSVRVAIFAGRNVSLIVEDAELPEIVNGKWKDDAKDDTTLCLTATIEESALNTWNENADTILTINKGVKFRAIEVDDSSGFVSNSAVLDDTAALELMNGDTAVGNVNGAVPANTLDDTDGLILEPEKITIRPMAALTTGQNDGVARDGDKTLSLTLKIWVTVEPGFTGDIILSTDEDNEAFGAQLEGIIAKAINPFEITTSSTPIDLGYMNKPVADIIIKENVAGAFDVEESGNRYDANLGEQLYTFRIAGYSWSNNEFFKDIGSAEVIDGDLLIEDYDSPNGLLELRIKRSSDEPSTVKISGITVDTNRWIAEGKLSLEMGGYATANWWDDDADTASFKKDWVEIVPDYLNIITSAPNKGTKVTTVVSVTIGADKLTADGKELPVDVPAFLETWTDGNGYTMVPVRAVAEALGSSNFQINWGETTKTVTIRDTGSGVVSQFTVGSNKVVVNGAPIEFSGPSCMIKDGRSFLPFRALGESVLNVPVYWDPETRTAWFNRYDAAAPTTSAAAE